jgi:hypothetical protein
MVDIEGSVSGIGFTGAGRTIGVFDVDSAAMGRGRRSWDPFIETWNDRIGDRYPFPEITVSTADGFEGRLRSVLLGDVAIFEGRISSSLRAQRVKRVDRESVLLYVGLRGAFALQDPSDRGGVVGVPAGTLHFQRGAAHVHLDCAPAVNPAGAGPACPPR